MKIPTPEKLPSGSYRVRLRLGGESISITRPTAAEATRAAELVKAEYRNDIRSAPTGGAVPLRSAIDAYISSRENILSPSTVRGYRAIQRSRFQPVMDRQIGAINWQKAVNDEARICSPKTLKNSWGFIRSVLTENGYDVTVRLPALTPPEKPWLTPEQIPVFMDAIKGQSCEIGALLALSSLRRSEIYGLRWEDIDLTQRVIHVRGAALQDESNAVVRVSRNKTSASTRTIPIMMPRLYELLAATENKTGMVMTGHIGMLCKHIDSVCKGVGLPLVGVHGLRHSFASLCYSLGISEMAAMQIGGWSDYQTMRKIYTHLSQNDRIKDAEKLALFFQNAHENAHE